MENILFGVIGLLSRLTIFWSKLIASIRRVFASHFPVGRLVEAGVGVMLWSVPLAFWAVVIRFVIKHW
jgi:hypothetical protein